MSTTTTLPVANDSENVLAVAKKLEAISSSSSSSDRVFLKEEDQVVSRNDTPALSQSDSEEEDSQQDDVEVQLKRDHEIEPIDIVYSKEIGAIEPTTRIVYPAGLNQYRFIGCGVRTKYLVFHAYAVGLYLDEEIMVKDDSNIRELLMDPKYPKVFRLVMNRNVTSSQYIGAIYDALSPLMRGQDMDKLEEMKTQEMPKMLNKGMEIFLTIKGNKLMMQVEKEVAGEIESIVLTRAVCENYVGAKPVSPAMKRAVWKGMEKLQKQQRASCNK